MSLSLSLCLPHQHTHLMKFFSAKKDEEPGTLVKRLQLTFLSFKDRSNILNYLVSSYTQSWPSIFSKHFNIDFCFFICFWRVLLNCAQGLHQFLCSSITSRAKNVQIKNFSIGLNRVTINFLGVVRAICDSRV